MDSKTTTSLKKRRQVIMGVKVVSAILIIGAIVYIIILAEKNSVVTPSSTTTPPTSTTRPSTSTTRPSSTTPPSTTPPSTSTPTPTPTSTPVVTNTPIPTSAFVNESGIIPVNAGVTNIGTTILTNPVVATLIGDLSKAVAPDLGYDVTSGANAISQINNNQATVADGTPCVPTPVINNFLYTVSNGQCVQLPTTCLPNYVYSNGQCNYKNMGQSCPCPMNNCHYDSSANCVNAASVNIPLAGQACIPNPNIPGDASTDDGLLTHTYNLNGNCVDSGNGLCVFPGYIYDSFSHSCSAPPSVIPDYSSTLATPYAGQPFEPSPGCATQ